MTIGSTNLVRVAHRGWFRKLVDHYDHGTETRHTPAGFRRAYEFGGTEAPPSSAVP